MKFKKTLLASLLVLGITPIIFIKMQKDQVTPTKVQEEPATAVKKQEEQVIPTKIQKEMLRQADYLYNKKEYHDAFKLYAELAEQGIEGVESRLFWMYEFGRGVRQDKQKAREWYKKDIQTRIKNLQIKVEQGDSKALYDLAYIYLDSWGDYNEYLDIPKGLDLLRKASEKGIRGASYSLGWHYLKGDIVRLDKVKAKGYFGLACDQGESSGCDEYKKLIEENK